MHSLDSRRLFLDLDALREWDTGIFQRFPKPEKVPITGLEPGPAGSWDARAATIYGSVLVEDGRFRMWYCGMPDAHSHDENPDHMYTCYAESDDGIAWRKPDLGITGRQCYPGNNLLALPGAVMGVVPALPGAGFRYLAAVIVIAALEPDVSEGFGYALHGNGTYLFASDDGLHWRQLGDEPIAQQGDVACLAVDPASNRYLLYQKVGCMHGLDARRSFIGMESADGIHWEGYQGFGSWRECFVADDFDDLKAQQAGLRIMDYYGIAAYRAGDLYVAVESIFNIGSPLRFAFAQNPNGLAACRLAFSHDGLHWRHPKGRPHWLEQGAPGDFDAGFLVTASTFTAHGDDLLLYYGGSRYDHGWCINPDFSLCTDVPLEAQRDSARIGLARITRDRFASLGATYQGRFAVDAGPRQGDALFVNARCPRGSLRVAISALGKKNPLPGCSFDDCLPFTGDAVRAPMRFKGAGPARIPVDLRLMLHFDLQTGDVYGYEWGGE